MAWFDISDDAKRFLLAFVVFVFSLILIVVIAYVFQNDTSNMVDLFKYTIAIASTWIAAIIAFYFGKENFRTGAEGTVNTLLATEGKKNYKDAPVSLVMIKKPIGCFLDDKMPVISATFANNDIERMPLFKTSDDKTKKAVEYILYKNDIPKEDLKESEKAIGALIDQHSDKGYKKRNNYVLGLQQYKVEYIKNLLDEQKVETAFIVNNDKEKLLLGMITLNQINAYLAK